MKRLLLLSLILVLTLSLMACSNNETSTEGKYTIGFVVSTQTNPFLSH